VVLGMLYFVLPEFTAIYQTFSTPLPLLTRMVIAAGDMLSRGWPLLLAFLLSPLLLNQLVRQRATGCCVASDCLTRSLSSAP
jgi:protein transport protein HofC